MSLVTAGVRATDTPAPPPVVLGRCLRPSPKSKPRTRAERIAHHVSAVAMFVFLGLVRLAEQQA